MNFNQIYKKVAHIAIGYASLRLATLFFLVITSKERMTKGVFTLYISKIKSNK